MRPLVDDLGGRARRRRSVIERQGSHARCAPQDCRQFHRVRGIQRRARLTSNQAPQEQMVRASVILGCSPRRRATWPRRSRCSARSVRCWRPRSAEDPSHRSGSDSDQPSAASLTPERPGARTGIPEGARSRGFDKAVSGSERIASGVASRAADRDRRNSVAIELQFQPPGARPSRWLASRPT
jgi:hypothetical protein